MTTFLRRFDRASRHGAARATWSSPARRLGDHAAEPARGLRHREGRPDHRRGLARAGRRPACGSGGLRAVQSSPGGLANARDATVYVNLEPCSHHGRTPLFGCARERAGARVCSRFPIRIQRSRAAAPSLLTQAGIKVEIGLMEAEAEELNAGFLMRMRHGAPFVRVKAAMSLDGRTALANGQSKWITSEAAREDVQHWRANSAAVLTGIGTVLADDPQLNVRCPRFERQPTVVVLDANCAHAATGATLHGRRAGGDLHQRWLGAGRRGAPPERRARRNGSGRGRARPARSARPSRRAGSERSARGGRPDAHRRPRAP